MSKHIDLNSVVEELLCLFEEVETEGQEVPIFLCWQDFDMPAEIELNFN